MQIVSDIYASTGKEERTHWGQTIDFSTVFGVIEVVTESESAQDIGVRFVSVLSQLVEQRGSLLGLRQSIQAAIPKTVTSLLLLIPLENSVQLLVFGAGSIYMRRGKTFALLTNKPGTINGEVKAQDIVLLFNPAAEKRCGKNVATILSPHLSPKEVAEALSIEFSEETKEVSAGEAGLIFAVQQVTSESSVVPRPVPPRLRQRRVDVQKYIQKVKELVHRRPYVVLAVGFGVFFAVSVFLGIKRQANDRQYQQMMSAYQDANSLFTQGIAVMDADSSKSLELLKQAQKRLQPLPLSALPKGKEARNIAELTQKIADNIAIVARVNKRDLQLFYDATFLQKERKITTMAVRNGNLFFLDEGAGMLAVVSLANKNAEILGGGNEFLGASSLAATAKAVYILTDQGVLSLLPGETDSKVVIPKDEITGSPDTLVTFGENVYLLDKGAGSVWRYVPKDNGFEKAQKFFAEDVVPDLSKTTNIVIDGSVWLGSQIGKVFRYTQGRDDPFLIRNVDPQLGQTLYVAKEDEGGTVYILDQDNKRVVSLHETGSYLAQYVWSQDLKPSALAVSEALKQVYLLADQKVYVLALQ